jgi:hypothetical protein
MSAFLLANIIRNERSEQQNVCSGVLSLSGPPALLVYGRVGSHEALRHFAARFVRMLLEVAIQTSRTADLLP